MVRQHIVEANQYAKKNKKGNNVRIIIEDTIPELKHKINTSVIENIKTGYSKVNPSMLLEFNNIHVKIISFFDKDMFNVISNDKILGSLDKDEVSCVMIGTVDHDSDYDINSMVEQIQCYEVRDNIMYDSESDRQLEQCAFTPLMTYTRVVGDVFKVITDSRMATVLGISDENGDGIYDAAESDTDPTITTTSDILRNTFNIVAENIHISGSNVYCPTDTELKLNPIKDEYNFSKYINNKEHTIVSNFEHDNDVFKISGNGYIEVTLGSESFTLNIIGV